MAIRVVCECGHEMRAKDEFAGRRVKCRECGETLTLRQSQRNGNRSKSDSYEEYDEYEGLDDDYEPIRSTRRRSKRRKRRKTALPGWVLPGAGIAVTVCIVGFGICLGIQAIPDVTTPSDDASSGIATESTKTVNIGDFSIDVPQSAAGDANPTQLPTGKVWFWDLNNDSEGPAIHVMEIPFDPARPPEDQWVRDRVPAKNAAESLAVLIRRRESKPGFSEATPIKEVTVNGLRLAHSLTRDKSGFQSITYLYRDGYYELIVNGVTNAPAGSSEYKRVDRYCRTLRRSVAPATTVPGIENPETREPHETPKSNESKSVEIEGFVIDLPPDSVERQPSQTSYPYLQIQARTWELPDAQGDGLVVKIHKWAGPSLPVDPSVRPQVIAKDGQETLAAVAAQWTAQRHITLERPVGTTTVNGLDLGHCIQRVQGNGGSLHYVLMYAFREGRDEIRGTAVTRSAPGSAQFEKMDAICKTLRRQ